MSIVSFRQRAISIIVVTALFAAEARAVANSLPSVHPGHDFATIPPGASYAQGQLLVRFAYKPDGTPPTAVEQNSILISLSPATVKRTFKAVHGLSLVELPPALTVEDALKVINKVYGVLYAEPDYIIQYVSMIPSDTDFKNLWGMHNTGQTGGTPDADIDAPEAWDITADANDIIVAVVDTGVDYRHPDLAVNMWTNPGEQPGDGNGDGKPGIAGFDDDGDGLIDEDSQGRQPGQPGYSNDLVNDDDENGYNDDIYGWDFADDRNDPVDSVGHGTHCAGIVGAIGNNNRGITGVCWAVKVMALGIGDDYPHTSAAIDAISYAQTQGVTVMNLSWTVPYSQSLKDTIQAADANGVLFVAAAGNSQIYQDPDNDQYPRYPASYDCANIIAVMATDQDDERSIWTEFPPSSSAYGAHSVDLGAPGTDVMSTLPSDTYGLGNGTSMAAPYVAGACALVWAANPNLSHLQIKDILLKTVDKPSSLHWMCVSEGRLNLYNALIAAGPLTRGITTNTPNPVLPGNQIQYTITCGNPITNPSDPNYLGDVTNVAIIDRLPDDVNFVSANPTGSFDPVERTYTWQTGTLSPGGSTSVTITICVNGLAEPLGAIRNAAVIQATVKNKVTYSGVVKETLVGCFGGNVIYVNHQASGYNSGTSWANAYTDLQKALARADAGCGSEIWVAGGVYKPVVYNWRNPRTSVSLDLVGGTALYAGFVGSETSRDQRKYRLIETVLSGSLDPERDCHSDYVLKANALSGTTTIDGFVIKDAAIGGLNCDNADLAINNCVIKDNGESGVNAFGSDVALSNCTISRNCADNSVYGGVTSQGTGSLSMDWCIVENNYSDGIQCRNQAEINNCKIGKNSADGIDTHCVQLSVKNSWIYLNGKSGGGGGVHLDAPLVQPLIYGSTIVYNDDYGIKTESINPTTRPDIRNCILWGNMVQFSQGQGYIPAYSCVQGLNDPNNGNINDNPLFAYSDPNSFNYHLASTSPCIDASDNNAVGTDETDIDAEPRKFDGNGDSIVVVDMGADEYYWSPADLNNSGQVNFYDYAIFGNSWQAQPDDYKYLAVLCEDWLWEFAAGSDYIGGAMAGGGEAAAGMAVEGGLAAETSIIYSEQESIDVDIDAIVDWLEGLWQQDEEIRSTTSEADWQAFVDSVKSATGGW
jgi:subtilisin family serine protease